MAIVNKIKINDESSGTIKLKNIGIDSTNVTFRDGDSANEKYTELDALIPTKEGGQKGFGSASIIDVAKRPEKASSEEIVLGADKRLFEVLEMNAKPDLTKTYTPLSFIVVVP